MTGPRRDGRELFAKAYISLQDHPKVLARSELAFAAYIRALINARVQRTGFIPVVSAAVIVRGGDSAHREAVLEELSTERQGTGPLLDAVWSDDDEPLLLGWQIHDWDVDNGLRGHADRADIPADGHADAPADGHADAPADGHADETPTERRRRQNREAQQRRRKKKKTTKQAVDAGPAVGSEASEELPPSMAQPDDEPADGHADIPADRHADTRAGGEKTREKKTREDERESKTSASALTPNRPPTPTRDKDGVISGVAANRVVRAFDAEWARVYGKPLGLSERHNAHYGRAADVISVAEKMAAKGEHWETWVARALTAAVPQLTGRKRPWLDFCETPAFWLEHGQKRPKRRSGGRVQPTRPPNHKPLQSESAEDFLKGAAAE
jgi:hypothetical protein